MGAPRPRPQRTNALPDWSDLKVFLYAAERGSIRAAARDLGMSQPMASQRIRTLEAALGVRLFNRRVNAVDLTDAGRETLEHARAMRDAMRKIENSVRMRDSRGEGRVRVAAPDGLAGLWLGPLLPSFYARETGIRLLLDAGIWPNDPLRDEVDLSIQFELTPHDEFETEVLGVAHYALYASPDYIAKHGRPTTWEEFRAQPRVHHVAHRHQRDTWNPEVTAGTWVPPIFETNSSPAMLEAVDAGVAVGLVPTWALQRYPRLTMLSEPMASLKFWLTYHRDIGKIARVRRVIDWLHEAFDPARYPWFGPDFAAPESAGER